MIKKICFETVLTGFKKAMMYSNSNEKVSSKYFESNIGKLRDEFDVMFLSISWKPNRIQLCQRFLEAIVVCRLLIS